MTIQHHSTVYITGASLLIGGLPSGTAAIGRSSAWDALVADKSLPAVEPNWERLRSVAQLEISDRMILSAHQGMALAGAELAWQEAALSERRQRIRGAAGAFRHPRIGCISGSSLGGFADFEHVVAGGERVSPYALSRWRGNAVGSAVSTRFGLGGGDYSMNAASATGAQCLHLGGTLIRAGLCDAMVVVAADAGISPVVKSAMKKNGSLTDDPAYGPLSSGRSGMNPVPGAACLILESEAHMKQRGGKPLAQWVDSRCANEAFHLLAPEPSGQVLRLLLQDLNFLPDWVSLHATGTPSFDGIEVAVVTSHFAQSTPWLTAMKRVTGHALGASGLIEAVMVVEGLQRGLVPPWPENTDPALGLASYRPQHPPVPQKALLVGQGMGGNVVLNALSSAF